MQTPPSALATCLGIPVAELPDGCKELLDAELERWQRISNGVLPASEIMRIADKIKYIVPYGVLFNKTLEDVYRKPVVEEPAPIDTYTPEPGEDLCKGGIEIPAPSRDAENGEIVAMTEYESGTPCLAFYDGTSQEGEYVSKFGDKHKVKIDGNVRIIPDAGLNLTCNAGT